MEMLRSINGTHVDGETVTLMEDLSVAMQLVESFGITPDEAMARIQAYDAELALRRGEPGPRLPECDESHARAAGELLEDAAAQLRLLSDQLTGLTAELRQLSGIPS